VATPPGTRMRIMKRVGLFQLVLATVRTQVAVVLLIGSVEFQQLLVVLGHRSGGLIGQSFGDGAAQVVAAGLDVFVGGEFLFFRHGGNWNLKFDNRN
jgi:hypothetical protein